MSQDRINKYAHILFNSLFLAFAVFGLYLSFCDAYRYNGDFGKIFFTGLVFSFITCALWMNNNLWCILGRLAVNVIAVIVIIREYARIEDEFGILYGYIKRQYYIYQGLGETPVNKIKTSVSILGIPVYEKLAMVLVIFMLITIMALAALRIKWYFLLMLPVVSVIGMEMFHGKAPTVTASFFLVTGVSGLLFSIKLELCGGKRNFWQDRHMPGQIVERYILFIGILAVCFIVSLAAGKATNKKIFANSGKVLKKQHKLERDAQALAETVKKHIINGPDGYLDNKSPDQTGRSVLRIETDRLPLNNIYIKSFSMDLYENGRWKPFNNVNPPVSEANIEVETYNSLKICIDAKKNVAESLDWTGYIDNYNMDIVPVWKFAGAGSFIPYMYNADTGSYQFNCYNMQNWMMVNILSMSDTEMEFYGIYDIEKYTSFVYDKYLIVPSGLSKLRALAERELLIGNNIGGMCMSVKNAICKDTRYSQNLEDVPAGQDYIEYFLFEQKRGYCEHYATAGTILLRLAGVPARYVSGYFVRPSEFKLEHDKSGNEKYVAYVKDYNAHAWTEVYKEGFGWLPFDMTNTVLDDSYNNIGDLEPEGTGDMQEDFSQEIDNSEEPGGTSSEDTASSTGVEFEQEEDLQEKEEILNNNTEKNSNSSNIAKDNSLLFQKVILIITVLLIIIMPLIYIRIRFLILYKKTSNADTSNKRIVFCFALLNKYLAFCGLKGVSKLEDAAYIEKISGLVTDGKPERAFSILQCAAFSGKNIDVPDEKEALLFIKNVSGSAYKRCHLPVRFIIYILTGRKEINIFTKVYN